MKNLLLIALLVFGTSTTVFAESTVGEQIKTDCKDGVQASRNANGNETVAENVGETESSDTVITE